MDYPLHPIALLLGSIGVLCALVFGAFALAYLDDAWTVWRRGARRG